jgi:hypothetical protein
MLSAIGRSLPAGCLSSFAHSYDNWLVGHAIKSGLSVVDLSPVVTVRHAFHSYAHVVGAASEPVDTADVLGGQERLRNLELDPGNERLMGSSDHAPFVAVTCDE